MIETGGGLTTTEIIMMKKGWFKIKWWIKNDWNNESIKGNWD